MHEKKKIFYYITTMNENYPHPEMPKIKNVRRVSLKECIKSKNLKNIKTKIQFLGSGTILRDDGWCRNFAKNII